MIENVTIRNFRSIGEVSVSLMPTTVLIGRSGVGKSNFLRAIRFLRNFLISEQLALNTEGGWQRIFPFGAPRPLSIEVSFRLPGFTDLFEYSIFWRAHPNQQGSFVFAEESLSVGSRKIIANGNRQGPFAPIQTQLGAMPTSTEAVLAFAALTGGIGWHDFGSAVFQAQNQGQGANKGLDDAANNYLTVLKDLTQDLRDQLARRQVVARLKQINPSIESVELNSILTPAFVIVGHRLGERVVGLQLAQESDGFRRYLAHLLAIYQTPSKQLLMFEEPENGISPGALKSLAEEFSNSPRNGRGQVLVSTQSPELLDGFRPELIRVVDIDPDTQLTKIGPLDAEQIEAVRDQLLMPGELLTVDMARRGIETAAAL